MWFRSVYGRNADSRPPEGKLNKVAWAEEAVDAQGDAAVARNIASRTVAVKCQINGHNERRHLRGESQDGLQQADGSQKLAKNTYYLSRLGNKLPRA